MAKSETLFPRMSEIKTPKGAEGWEEMYVGFHIPKGEMKESEDSRFWFHDTIHKPNAVFPFDTYDPESWGLALAEHNTHVFEVPAALGVDQRIVNGYLYISPSYISDPEVVKRRANVFRERANYYYDKWIELSDQRKKEVYEMNRELETLDFRFPSHEKEVERYVYSNEKGKLAPPLRLIKNYNRLVEMIYTAWQDHFEFINLGYAAYLTYYDYVKELFPDISDVTVTSMVAGVEAEAYQPQEYLFELADLAISLGVDAIFERYQNFGEGDIDGLFASLRESETGRSWIKRFEEIKDPWFNVASGRGYSCQEFSWLDRLSLPLGTIIDYVRRIKAGKSVQRPLKDVVEKRQKLVDGYMGLLRSEGDKKKFQTLISLTQKVFRFVEGHQFYLDNWFHQAMYRKMRELGKTLADYGFIGEASDIFYLHRFEIYPLVYELCFNWAMGYPVSKGKRWKEKIEKRKRILEVLDKWTPPPALGNPPDKVTDPFARMLWGITRPTLERWKEAMSGVKTEVIRGVAASPGKATGVARVLHDPSKLGELRDGEILVAPLTSPSWAFAFVKIKGAVTDEGGIMSHAAIVCREYRLPLVAGTGLSTKRIKTGDMLEVDGDAGTVRVLSRNEKPRK